jgi:hypothetical protein
MIRKTEVTGRFEDFSLEEWVKQIEKRIQLQKASVNICEEVLENLEQGKSIFEIAENIKKLHL